MIYHLMYTDSFSLYICLVNLLDSCFDLLKCIIILIKLCNTFGVSISSHIKTACGTVSVVQYRILCIEVQNMLCGNLEEHSDDSIKWDC